MVPASLVGQDHGLADVAWLLVAENVDDEFLN